jgi:hypothetical protein
LSLLALPTPDGVADAPRESMPRNRMRLKVLACATSLELTVALTTAWTYELRDHFAMIEIRQPPRPAHREVSLLMHPRGVRPRTRWTNVTLRTRELWKDHRIFCSSDSLRARRESRPMPPDGILRFPPFS